MNLSPCRHRLSTRPCALAWITLDLDQAGIAIMFAFPAAIAIIFAARYAYLRFSSSDPIAN